MLKPTAPPSRARQDQRDPVSVAVCGNDPDHPHAWTISAISAILTETGSSDARLAAIGAAMRRLREATGNPAPEPTVRPCAWCGEKQVADDSTPGRWEHDVMPAPGSPCAGHGAVPIPDTIQWPGNWPHTAGADLAGGRAVCRTCSRTLVVVDGYDGPEWVHEAGGAA